AARIKARSRPACIETDGQVSCHHNPLRTPPACPAECRRAACGWALEGFGKGRAAKLAHGRLFGAARRGERAGALRRCDLIETSAKIGKSRRLMACPGDCIGLFPGRKLLRSIR